jgi:hypothetical protein
MIEILYLISTIIKGCGSCDSILLVFSCKGSNAKDHFLIFHSLLVCTRKNWIAPLKAVKYLHPPCEFTGTF